jgi:hypothetical protein
VNTYVEIEVTKYSKINFGISAYFIDEVELDVVPLNVCGVLEMLFPLISNIGGAYRCPI